VCVCVYLYRRPTCGSCTLPLYARGFLLLFFDIPLFRSIATAPATDPDEPIDHCSKIRIYSHSDDRLHDARTHTRAYEKVLGKKKLTPTPRARHHPFSVAVMPSVLRATMGTPRGTLRQKRKKNSVCPVRGPSRIRSCPGPLCADPILLLLFFPPVFMYSVPPFHANNYRR